MGTSGPEAVWVAGWNRGRGGGIAGGVGTNGTPGGAMPPGGVGTNGTGGGLMPPGGDGTDGGGVGTEGEGELPPGPVSPSAG